MLKDVKHQTIIITATEQNNATEKVEFVDICNFAVLQAGL